MHFHQIFFCFSFLNGARFRVNKFALIQDLLSTVHNNELLMLIVFMHQSRCDIKQTFFLTFHFVEQFL